MMTAMMTNECGGTGGEVDGHYVIRTVTVWEINFWEACEFSIARQSLLDADYIQRHLDDHHMRDLADLPQHWSMDNTPTRSCLSVLGCLCHAVWRILTTYYHHLTPNLARFCTCVQVSAARHSLSAAAFSQRG